MRIQRLVKKIAITLVFLLLITFVGGAVFLLTFNPSQYKAGIVKAVQEKYGRKLNINGDIRLSLFPRIGLNLSQISLSEANSDTEFAFIDQANLAVAIWPLFSKRFLVDHIAINGFKLNLERRPDNGFNIDDFYTETNQSLAQNQNSLLLQNDFKIDLAGLIMQNGQVFYNDQPQNQRLELSQVSVNTGRIEKGQAFTAELKAKVNAGQATDNADLIVKGEVLYEPQKSIYKVKGLNFNLRGKLGQWDFDQGLAKGNVQISGLPKSVSVSDVEVAIKANGVNKNEVNVVETSIKTDQLDVNPSATYVVMKDFKMNGQSTHRAGKTYQWDFQSPQLAITSSDAKGEPLTGKLSIRSDTDVEINLLLNQFSGTATHLSIGQITANTHYRLFDKRSILVDMTSPGQINLFNQSMQLPAVSGVVKFSNDSQQIDQEVPFTGKLNVDLLAQNLDFNTQAVYGDSKLSINGNIDGRRSPPLKFEIEGDYLNADALLKKIYSKKVAPLVRSLDKQMADEAEQNEATPQVDLFNYNLERALLNRLNGEGILRVKSLSYQNLPFENVQANLSLDASRRIGISSVQAHLLGGIFSGKGFFDLDKGGSKFEADIKQVQMQAFLKRLNLPDVIEGQGQVHLRLNNTYEAYTVSDRAENTSTYYQPDFTLLNRAFQGEIAVQVSQGQIRGLDLNAWSNPDSWVLSSKKPASFSNENLTAFQTLSLGMQVQDDRVDIKKFQLDLSHLNFSLMQTGTLHLKQNTLELPVRLYFKQGWNAHNGVHFHKKQVQIPMLLKADRQKGFSAQIQQDQLNDHDIKKAITVLLEQD